MYFYDREFGPHIIVQNSWTTKTRPNTRQRVTILTQRRRFQVSTAKGGNNPSYAHLPTGALASP